MTDGNERVGSTVVWIALALAALYIAIHLPMLYRSVIQWEELLSALFGQ